jgi:hypothetical protein
MTRILTRVSGSGVNCTGADMTCKASWGQAGGFTDVPCAIGGV